MTKKLALSSHLCWLVECTWHRAFLSHRSYRTCGTYIWSFVEKCRPGRNNDEFKKEVSANHTIGSIRSSWSRSANEITSIPNVRKVPSKNRSIRNICPEIFHFKVKKFKVKSSSYRLCWGSQETHRRNICRPRNCGSSCWNIDNLSEASFSAFSRILCDILFI